MIPRAMKSLRRKEELHMLSLISGKEFTGDIVYILRNEKRGKHEQFEGISQAEG
jgi:hypothetical protein